MAHSLPLSQQTQPLWQCSSLPGQSKKQEMRQEEKHGKELEQEQEQNCLPQAPSSLSPSTRLVHLDLSQNLFTSLPVMQGLDRLEVLSLQVSGQSSVYRLMDSPQSTGHWTVLSLQETLPVTCPLAQFESSCPSAILNVPLSPGCQVDWGLSLPVHQSAQVLPVLYYITPAPLHPGSSPGFTASACTTPAWQTSLPVRRNSGRRKGGGGCDN